MFGGDVGSQLFQFAVEEWDGQCRRHWRFPSDHLPVGCVLLGAETPLRVVSWNILNSKFNVENLVGQGMDGSLPHQLYHRTEDCTSMGPPRLLTRRDALVLLTLERFLRPDSPQHAEVVALQECAPEVLQALRPLLKRWGYREAKPPKAKHSDDSVVLYDTAQLVLVGSSYDTDVFSDSRKGFLVATFARPGLNSSITADGVVDRLRIVAGKIPGAPPKPPALLSSALEEWATFATRIAGTAAPPVSGVASAQPPRSVVTLYLGDFNFQESEIGAALLQASGGTPWLRRADLEADARRLYATNITPMGDAAARLGGALVPKRIDHILEAGGADACASAGALLLEPDELLPGCVSVRVQWTTAHCARATGSRRLLHCCTPRLAPEPRPAPLSLALVTRDSALRSLP
jgi:hypothetical protein